MDNAPAAGVAYSLNLRPTVKEPRRQGCSSVTGPRMSYDSSRLIHHRQIVVLPHDLEVDRLGY